MRYDGSLPKGSGTVPSGAGAVAREQSVSGMGNTYANTINRRHTVGSTKEDGETRSTWAVAHTEGTSELDTVRKKIGLLGFGTEIVGNQLTSHQR